MRNSRTHGFFDEEHFFRDPSNEKWETPVAATAIKTTTAAEIAATEFLEFLPPHSDWCGFYLPWKCHTNFSIAVEKLWFSSKTFAYHWTFCDKGLKEMCAKIATLAIHFVGHTSVIVACIVHDTISFCFIEFVSLTFLFHSLSFFLSLCLAAFAGWTWAWHYLTPLHYRRMAICFGYIFFSLSSFAVCHIWLQWTVK